MFDPTDPFTPLGELPTADQGSLALVVSAGGGPLVRLPESGPDANGTERAIEGTIDEAGRLTATLRDRLSGRAAVAAREQYRGLSPEAYRKTMTDRLAREVPRAAVGSIEAEDAGRSFGLEASLDAPAYGQVIQNRLMVVRCPTALAGALPSLPPAAGRRTPVVLGPSRSTETFILTPAPGLKVDELPPDASADTPYGSYRLRTRREGERVIVDREITTRRVTVPVADYPAVRAFVEGARAVDAATIVFTRAQERVRSIAATTAR